MSKWIYKATFTKRDGTKFIKVFNSLASRKRAISAWKNKGGEAFLNRTKYK